MEPLLPWLWVVVHSLAWAVVPGVILVLALLIGGWWLGLGWQSLWAVPLAGVLVAGGWYAYGQLLPTQGPVRSAESSFRLAQLNMYYLNDQPAQVMNFIATSQADLVSLQEVSAPVLAQLETVSGTYPHQQLSRARLSMALLSIYPLTRAQAWGDRAVLYHVGRPAAQGGAFYVLQTHPQSPYQPEALTRREDKLAELAKALPLLPRPLLLVGDFNTVPWDPALQSLLAHAPLAGGWRAWLPSYPTVLPLTPLDHVLASPHWPSASAQRVRVEGADHVGLIVDFRSLQK